ncbi:hypothetical protein CC80DRAFT_544079 [Byssothecium circinans]|uniref:Fatty acid hydroxylase domain-containing protein n=1 Tax=Byssothecium circinans TaxID=147558 RepID=A0A6A5U728_9PLEO|nr:hypothetical protein CC80DRAFT_544079 [Byssothecium circinans]
MNETLFDPLLLQPRLPPEAIYEKPPLFSFIGDQHLPYVVPAIVYWAVSCSFHLIDAQGWLASYKVHTPAEFLTRNRVTRSEVIMTVLTQQFFMAVCGYLMSDPVETVCSHEYGVAVWAKRVRIALQYTPYLLSIVGIDKHRLGLRLGGDFGAWLARGYPNECLINAPNPSDVCLHAVQNFSETELAIASALYWIIFPVFQFLAALVFADTMYYFQHRAFHSIPWLYRNIHSQHHRVYVNFAYGAYYNHALEGVPIDGILFPLCLKLAGLTTLQSTVFNVIWTVKVVSDHTGYALPWDPSNLLCKDSQWYHDLHHQHWGLKYNFSQWTPFWDWCLGTLWDAKHPDAQEKYAKTKELAEKEFAQKVLKAHEAD